MKKFKIAEHFVSINGEGNRLGELAYFIRFPGCNLTCSYCDTDWVNQPDTPYSEMSAEEIFDAVRFSGVRNVTLTGGEPLLQENISSLIELLNTDDRIRMEIETNGSADIAPLAGLKKRPAFTLDYKLPSSEMEIMMRVSNFDLLASQDTVKFVAGSSQDLRRAATVIDAYDLAEKCSVHLSPVFGEIEPADLVEFMKENRMNGVSLRLQMHKQIWDPQTRGV